MIDRQVIEDLITLMVDHDLVELDVADGDQSVTLRRAGADAPVQFVPAPTGATAPAPAVEAAPALSTAPVADAGAVESDGLMTIDSPMVGTYYSKPNPDAEPFISVGSKVSGSSVVCLVEAMKVFNEIKADCNGTIVEVLVTDGDAIEYGQPLFKVKAV